ncbi:MAG TPA: hypothetical protein VMW56_21875 [Candidatus Margulisiibacteriota bacterium]|nr:hypothetical protein [Candidatus Margulisiibacteriota bacterium]
MRSGVIAIVAVTSTLTAAALVSCSGGKSDVASSPDASGASAPARTTSPVVVTAWPGAECDIHLFGDPTGATPLFADDLGRVRFAAVHQTPKDEVTAVSLDCHDDSGRKETYTLDLTSPRTFELPPPVPPEQWPPGSLRSPLAGNPLAYTQNELQAMGFPRRPDPITQAAQYNHWLATASKPARRVLGKGHSAPPGTGSWTSDYYKQWAGSILSAKQCNIFNGCQPNCNNGCETFYTTEAYWYLPTLTTVANSDLAQWVGVNGNYDVNAVSLVQCGVNSYYTHLFGNIYYMSYSAFTQLYSGTQSDAGGYASPKQWFPVDAGDEVYAQAWVCDNEGNYTPSGNYGCFYVADDTESDYPYIDCNSPTGGPGTESCPSLLKVNPFTGTSAEVAVETNVDNMTPFTEFGFIYYGVAQEQNGTDVTYDNGNDSANVANLYSQPRGQGTDVLAEGNVYNSDQTNMTFYLSQ